MVSISDCFRTKKVHAMAGNELSWFRTGLSQDKKKEKKMDNQVITALGKSFRSGNSSLQYITGRLVDGDGRVLKTFGKMYAAMDDGTKSAYSRIFQMVLSGKAVSRYTELLFDNSRSAEWDRLAHLVCDPYSEEKRQEMMDNIAKNIYADLPYEQHLILLADGWYYIPKKESSFAASDDPDGYHYHFLIGAVCPVREAKHLLCYDEKTEMFRMQDHGPMEVKDAVTGFLFPSIEDGKPDGQHALCMSGVPSIKPAQMLSGKKD